MGFNRGGHGVRQVNVGPQFESPVCSNESQHGYECVCFCVR